MTNDYESEQSLTREEAATALRDVADAVAAGSLAVEGDDEPFTVAIPETVEFELEVEREADTRELEIELEWPEEGATHPAPAVEEGDAEEGVVDSGALPAGPAEPLRSIARFELFRDRGEEWRWRLRHRNGNVIATSGEAYTQKHNAKKGLRSVMKNAPGAETVEESDR